MQQILNKIAKLIDLKSIVTLLMTVKLAQMLSSNIEVNQQVLALFCTSYGAITTFFFTRPKKEKDGEQ